MVTLVLQERPESEGGEAITSNNSFSSNKVSRFVSIGILTTFFPPSSVTLPGSLGWKSSSVMEILIHKIYHK